MDDRAIGLAIMNSVRTTLDARWVTEFEDELETLERPPTSTEVPGLAASVLRQALNEAFLDQNFRQWLWAATAPALLGHATQD